MLLQYDGTPFVGWQVQPNGVSVQGSLQEALERITGKACRITGASRTDAGVHALYQVAAFTTDTGLDGKTLVRALNAHTPREIIIRAVEETEASFHPRYAARGKRYAYLLSTGAASPFFRGMAWHLPFDLDLSAMRTGLAALIGRHDFSSFRASGCGAKHPIRTVTRISVDRIGDPEIMGLAVSVPVVRIRVEADAFLRYMVRNIVGLAVDMGRGRTDPDLAGELLASGDRCRLGQTAPARGLFLEKIFFDPPVFQDFHQSGINIAPAR